MKDDLEFLRRAALFSYFPAFRSFIFWVFRVFWAVDVFGCGLDKEAYSEVIGKDWVLVDESVSSYLYDETPSPVRPVASGDVVVVKPGSALEVSKILLLANEFRVPVFPRGGGTGLVGGCIPTRSGIVVSLKRMNRINVDRDNLFAEAEAEATLRDLISAAESAGLFFPPHPGDESAQIGGLIACNAGGVRAVKTGVMRNYVMGLEVVLPTGEIIMLGGKLLKNNAGYDLMQLIIGSEGTYPVLKKTMYNTLDVTLPPASMAGFLDELDKIAGKYGVELPAIGHAGDGNLHVWINVREGWRPEDYEKIKEEVYDKVIELGGVITGEHGIRYVKRRDLQKIC